MSAQVRFNQIQLASGQRVFIGGASPSINSLPSALLETGKVIGINAWAATRHCDYWIGLDTGLNWEKYYLDTEPEYCELPKFLRTLAAPRFMRRPNKDSEAFVPADAGIFFEKPHQGNIPIRWDGTLQWESSTALAAINLAIVLGASEVVLYGVDFVGHHRADGSSYGVENFWIDHESQINALLRRYQELIPVYKTNPDSWLDCPLLEVA